MVKVYDNIIPDKLCQLLINGFENCKDQEFINDDNCPCFTQVNVNHASKGMAKLITPFVETAYKKYKDDVKSKYLPIFKELEQFRIKRYLTNGKERFDEHVDVTDFDSSIRALAFLFYLNDNDGNTLFPLHKLNIKPISGRVVIFPPTWEYPHQGLAPKNNPKYIMSTYVHYGEN
tara:strand:- start:376 stop:900 length:525 start_codon:yes stop_codon:yes gene_type:complete